MGGYRVNRQQPGTRVSFWPDPRGPEHGELKLGYVIEHNGDCVHIIWDNDDDYYETWTAGDIKYRIDRGQMRLTPPPKKRRLRIPEGELICKQCGQPRSEGCGHKSPGAVKPEDWGSKSVTKSLTAESGSITMVISHDERNDDARTKKGATPMATKKKDTEAPAKAEPLSAKEAATELGTDARTLRKFLRKKNGLVGQGQRWAIDRSDIPELKAEFANWAKGSGDKAEPKGKGAKAAPIADDEPMDDLEADFEDLSDELDEVELDLLDDMEDLEEVD